MNRHCSRFFCCIVLLLPLVCLPALAAPRTAKPSVAEAQKFVADAEATYSELIIKYNRAAWVQSNFITDDTEIIAADALKELTAAASELAEKSRRFDGLKLPYDTARKIQLLKRSLTTPAPRNPKEIGRAHV